jgi:hypothetical protein
MVKSTLVLCIFLSLSARLSAQQSYECENKVLTKSLEEKLSGYVLGQPVDNNQFYSNDWCEAIVTLADGRTISGEFLKYNGYLEKFIWLKTSTNQQLILNDENIEKVNLISGKLTGTSYFERIKVKRWYDTDSVSVFLEVLTEGPISLYAQRKITTSQSSNEFTNEYLYFIKTYNNPLSVIKPRKKNLLAALGEYEDECKDALKKADLSVSNEYELIRVVEYLNSAVDFNK